MWRHPLNIAAMFSHTRPRRRSLTGRLELEKSTNTRLALSRILDFYLG